MKKEDFSKLSETELVELVNETTSQLRKMKVSHSISPIENAIQIRTIRKNIARMNTEITKRELKK